MGGADARLWRPLIGLPELSGLSGACELAPTLHCCTVLQCRR